MVTISKIMPSKIRPSLPASLGGVFPGDSIVVAVGNRSSCSQVVTIVVHVIIVMRQIVDRSAVDIATGEANIVEIREVLILIFVIRILHDTLTGSSVGSRPVLDMAKIQVGYINHVVVISVAIEIGGHFRGDWIPAKGRG